MEFLVPGFFTALKRVLTGEVLKRRDIPIKGAKCTISLRLKRNNSETYVVLATATFGNSNYVAMDRNEFDQLAHAFEEVGRDLRALSESAAL